jgi:two-component system, OmpR family, alkaline phosphatase synthesis response regulator PhoP
MTMQILVIDDDHNLLDNVSTILELAGYEVLRADNGVDGLRLIRDYHPALIICDIMMPEVSGYDVLEELQANSSTITIPLIFLTAKSDIYDVRHGMQAGADDYLTKPFTEQDLLNAVQVRLEKRQRWELQQRTAFAHDLVQTQENEAQRIAQQLDQGFRQKLLNIKFFLDTQLHNSALPSETLMEQVQRSLDELLNQINNLSHSLYPVMLGHLGLIPMLQWYFKTVQQRLNVAVKFDHYNMESRLVDASELILYRIAQRVMENLTTAAQTIHVVLWRDENSVRFSISHLPVFDKTQQWRLLQLLEGYGRTINASVVVQDEEDHSSTVYVTLPDAVFQQVDAPVPLTTLQPVAARDTVLLIISPDGTFLEQVTRMLASIVRVIPYQAESSDTLLTQIGIHAPHIVVLDLFVPSSVLSRLSRETAVIVLSPYSDEAFARQTLRQGVMGFIPKAKAGTELVAAVQTVMHRERYLSVALVLGSDGTQNTKSLNLDALLTRREREIMELILQDKTHADIAGHLVISPRTVEKHRANMMQKLALSTHTELILFALRYGLMSSQ